MYVEQQLISVVLWLRLSQESVAACFFTLMLRLKVKSDGTALSFSTLLLHSILKQSLVKCCEQILLYFVGLKLFLLIAATHLPQMSGRAKGNL